MNDDPYAAMAARRPATTAPPVPTPTPSSVSEVDPFVSAHDTDDPFGTSSEYAGGVFVPRPKLEDLRGRLVVMIPRAFDPEAEDRLNGGTREQYTVDLTVLSGGSFRFLYNTPADPERGTQAGVEEFDAGNVDVAPFTSPGYWVPQGVLVGMLKRAHADRRPLLGIIDVGPTAANRRERGETAAQTRAAYDAWVKRGRVGARPRSAWVLDTPTPEQRKVAVAWWAANRDSIDPIMPPTG